jgi:hypothetical protein
MLSSKKSWEVASCSQGNTSVSCGSIAAARYSYLSVSYVPKFAIRIAPLGVRFGGA